MLIQIRIQSQEKLDCQKTPPKVTSRAQDPFINKLKFVDQYLDDFEALAQPIIGIGHAMTSRAPATAVELEKLSVKGRALARLYHCLG